MVNNQILTDAQKRKKKKGLCIVPHCMKKFGAGFKCYSCEKKVYIKNHPLEYAYNVKRSNAKRKKKFFSLTFEEFKSFVIKNNYMKKKGTSAKSLTMDRKKDCTPECPKEFCKKHGYFYKNIQAITLTENIYKYNRHKKDFSDVPF